METDLGLDFLSPTEPIGLLILIAGIFFTGGVFYIFLSLDKESISDRKTKAIKEENRLEKIRKLYPKKR